MSNTSNDIDVETDSDRVDVKDGALDSVRLSREGERVPESTEMVAVWLW